MIIVLSVKHLDDKQLIDAEYAGDVADESKLAREIVMPLGPTPDDESGLCGGTFFCRVDYKMSPRGGVKETFHAHVENEKLMIGTTEFTGDYMEFDGVRISIDQSAARRK